MGGIAEYFASFKIDGSEGLKTVEKIDKRANSLGDRFSKIGSRFQSGLEKVRVPAALIAGAGLGIGKVLISEAQDLQESVNAVRVTFGDYADDVIAFGKSASSSVGLSAREFNQLATKLRPSLEQAGFQGDELNQKLFELAVRAADTGSIFNKDTTTVIDKFAAALRGSGEPVEELGVIINNAALEEEALAQGITKSVAKMSNQEKVALRLSSVLKQTSKNQGDFARTLEDPANKSKKLQKDVANLRGELGTKLLPIYSKLLKIASKVVDWFSSLSDGTQDLIVKGGLLATAFAGIAVAASFIVPILAAITGPVALVSAAVVGAGVLIVKYWEEVKAFFSGFATGFSAEFQPVISTFSRLFSIVKPVFNFIGSVLSKIFAKLFPVREGMEGVSKAGESMGRIVGKALRALFLPLEGLVSLIEKVIEGFNKIKDAIPDLDQIKETLSDPDTYIPDFVKSGVREVSNFFSSDDEVERRTRSLPSLRNATNQNVSNNNTLTQNIEVNTSDPDRAAQRVTDLTNIEFAFQ